MRDEIGTYSFLPLLRQGLANKVVAPADANAKRGKITVTLNVTGSGLTDPGSESVEKEIEIYGPGDIIGIDPKAIIKTEPRNWITNFEPNYLPHIDFYDEDFPWRYTPSAVVGARLTPWLALVVLSEDEFDDGKNILNRPLNYLTLKDTADASTVFPKEEDLWAWAHVHVNKNIVGSDGNPISTDEAAFIGQFKNTLNDNPDLAYSRIMSPRKLGENTPYHAFLIPTFESGRLAGLGIDPSTVSGFGANTIAWSDYGGRQEAKSFPYYHRWYFRTATVGDFEYLVRLLEPKLADSRVGLRDMDMQNPGSNIDGIDDDRLKGILRLGGALQVPSACLNEEETTEYRNYDQWYDSYPHPFQQQLSAFINLADEYTSKTTVDAHNDSGLVIEDENLDDPDPLITPPLYGRWHALTSRLLNKSDGSLVSNNENWVHDLNLDPRWRTSANFGTNVVQDKQEEYMNAAWEQVGDVLEANRRLRWAKLASFTSRVWYTKNILPRAGVALEKYLKITTPIQTRILSDGVTVSHTVKNSRVPQALISAPMRRIIRPRGRMIRRLSFDAQRRQDNFITRVNEGDVDPAPPREVPDELVTHNDLVDTVKPANVPSVLLDLLSRYSWLQYLPLFLAIIIILLLLITGLVGSTLFSATATVAVATVTVFLALRRLTKKIKKAEGILPEQQTPESVDDLPGSPDFRVTEFNDPFVPQVGVVDSPEGKRYKKALRDNYDFVQRSVAAGEPPVYTALNIPLIVNDITTSIDPVVTIPRYVLGHINLPPRLVNALVEKFVEAMAYPEIDVPMYKPLLDLSADHFVPNINLIEQNSITILETNQRFIESYMVGINHEFSRELLWREYPTDQRGSYFRQFWDVSSYLNKEGLDEDVLKEKLRDIPPIHRWSRRSDLGDHDHREQGGDKEEEVVLVVRGELLKKYPTAEVYAHRAKWATDDEGNRVLTKARDFDNSEFEKVVIKTPLYEAKVEPDIYFFGFDLNVKEAKGGSGENDEDKAGWFFVIKERSGEPRFGLDVPGDASDMSETTLDSWNDLAWSHVVENVTAGKFLSITGTRTISVPAPGAPPAGDNKEREQQQLEDSHLQWKSNTNAAELAYILYQVPVLIGIHAAEMLPDKCDNTVEG
ncbi:MAG: hypothetical protein GXP23_01435 [Gammaproteobacteria bacterium]|nr:hypothetical protein [Gammaproteobacteria bacterium]